MGAGIAGDAAARSKRFTREGIGSAVEIGEWMIVQLINTLTDTANARAPVGGVTRQGLVVNGGAIMSHEGGSTA